MDIIEIQTLVDVTNTQVLRINQGSKLEYDQNRNFVTLIQCAEIRSVVSYHNPPLAQDMLVTDMGFGDEYTGVHRVWTISIIPDRAGVYNLGNSNAVEGLIDDIDGVPIIKNLTETINMSKAIFNCKDPFSKNTIIKAHPGTI
jgi:hypothetical protein